MATTALITGASEGIGKAIALLLAQKGYDLVLAARREEPLAAVAATVRSLGRQAIAIPTDVRDPAQVDVLVQKALEAYPTIDVLVNNAGIYVSGAAEEFSLDDWRQAMDTNVWGCIHLIHALLPHLLQQGQGTIVNVSSIGGKIPMPYLVPYCTTKYAITGMTESLHSELAPKGIHVFGVYPNLIKTRFVERAIFRGKDEQASRDRRQQIEQLLQVPLVETPEVVAQAVWDGIVHKKTEVVVGSANLSTAAHRLFPNLVQWVLRQTFHKKA